MSTERLVLIGVHCDFYISISQARDDGGEGGDGEVEVIVGGGGDRAEGETAGIVGEDGDAEAAAVAGPSQPVPQV